MKCVMIIDHNLPVGLIANTSAALGISIASAVTGLSGKPVRDADGRDHAGVTRVPIPVLALEKGELKTMYDELMQTEDEEMRLIGFNDVAQKCADYSEYTLKIAAAGKEDLNYLGFCVYGSREKVNKLTGSIRMLR